MVKFWYGKFIYLFLKKFFFILPLTFFSLTGGVLNAQGLSFWDFDSQFNQKNEATSRESKIELLASTDRKRLQPGDVFILTIEGRVDFGQHIYSVEEQGGFAPEPTQLTIDSPYLILRKPVRESPPKRLYDKAFEQELWIHEGDFRISQPVQVSNKLPGGEYQFYGDLRYQICDNRICSLPQKRSFSFEIIIQ